MNVGEKKVVVADDADADSFLVHLALGTMGAEAIERTANEGFVLRADTLDAEVIADVGPLVGWVGEVKAANGAPGVGGAVRCRAVVD